MRSSTSLQHIGLDWRCGHLHGARANTNRAQQTQPVNFTGSRPTATRPVRTQLLPALTDFAAPRRRWVKPAPPTTRLGRPQRSTARQQRRAAAPAQPRTRGWSSPAGSFWIHLSHKHTRRPASQQLKPSRDGTGGGVIQLDHESSSETGLTTAVPPAKSVAETMPTSFLPRRTPQMQWYAVTVDGDVAAKLASALHDRARVQAPCQPTHSQRRATMAHTATGQRTAGQHLRSCQTAVQRSGT